MERTSAPGRGTMTLRIRACAAGPLETNAYLVADEATGEAILVDAPPGVTPALIALAAGLQVRRIVVTHGHWDHIADAAALVEATGVPLAAHPLTAARMADPPGTAQGLPFDIAPAEVTETLGEGDEVRVGDVICIVEAMKMENEVRAHRGGTVTQLSVAAGQPVSSGQTICVIAEERGDG